MGSPAVGSRPLIVDLQATKTEFDSYDSRESQAIIEGFEKKWESDASFQSKAQQPAYRAMIRGYVNDLKQYKTEMEKLGFDSRHIRDNIRAAEDRFSSVLATHSTCLTLFGKEKEQVKSDEKAYIAKSAQAKPNFPKFKGPTVSMFDNLD